MNNHEDLKIQYQMDEMVHPTGRAWEWWEVKDFLTNYDAWRTPKGPLRWDSSSNYRRKECAPTVYDDHGVVRVMDDDTCDNWDKAVSPTTVVTTTPVRVDSSTKPKPMHDQMKDEIDAQILDELMKWAHGEYDEEQVDKVAARDILDAAAKHMQDRAATYDAPDGERSMWPTVDAFNAITGHELSEEQGWLFMTLLKAVRSQQGDYRADNYEDGAAYFALMGEAAAQDRKKGETK